ncbi:MAG: enoyl-CoA hydratase/isomerase family protein [Chloroflexi bacterium]|nr:enoyl-CoA hydratase/isomerase family protein [Chloroflexota bacterium]
MPVVLFEKKGHIAYVTLNRPEAFNSINKEVWELSLKAFEQVRDDNDIWVAIVTGAGEKAFCAGADLKEMSGIFQAAIQAGKPPALPVPLIHPMRGIEVYKPFIAAVNGVALGGGCELMLACDLRIAAEHARIGTPEVKQGIIPTAGGTQRIPRQVPWALAMQMLLTGEPVTAQEALRIGLINQVVPLKDLMPAAEALANKINENGPIAVRGAKEAAYRGVRMPLEDGLRLEELISANVVKSEDAMEGPKAFSEKRKPNYKGR